MKKKSYKLLFLFVILSVLGSMASTTGRYVTSWTSPAFSLSIKASAKLVLKFDANGGSNAPSEIVVELADGETKATITIPNKKPSKSGSIFAGWKAPDGEIYHPEDEIVLTENLTLIALWETRNVARVYDIFYNGSGFYADPNCKKGIRILSDNSIDITGSDSTEVTKLSDLNGTTSYRTSSGSPIENYNIWFDATYTPAYGESLEGKYILRRYTTNRFGGALILVSSGVTAYFNTTIDGNKSANTAYYLNNSNALTSASVAARDAEYALIRVQGTLNMTGGSVQNNSSFGTYEGGAGIAVTGSGSLNMSAGTIQGNEFKASKSYNGSGISVDGASAKLNITGGTITNNVSTKMSGGGIAIYNSSNLYTIKNCTFTNNKGSKGAAIAVANKTAKLSLTNCTITGNTATGGGTTDGGAIFLNADVTLNLSSTTISGNSGKMSGGICTMTDKPTINLSTGTVITNNKATDYNGKGAGGIYCFSGVNLKPRVTDPTMKNYVYGNVALSQNVDIYYDYKYYMYDAPAATFARVAPVTEETPSVSLISQFFTSEATLPAGATQQDYEEYRLYTMPSDAELENWKSERSAKAGDNYSFYGWRIVYGSGSELIAHDNLKAFLQPLFAENASLQLTMYPVNVRN